MACACSTATCAIRWRAELKLVRFYLTGDEPVESAIAPVVAKAKQVGARMLIVSDHDEQLEALDKSLWEDCADQFLAHGRADARFAERQPVLLSKECRAANGAQVVAFADGVWRGEADAFERAFLFFSDAQRDSVRPVWSSFDGRSELTREYYRLEQGKWRKIL